MPLPRFILLLLPFFIACNETGSENPFEAQLQTPPYLEWSEKITSAPKNDSLYFQRAMLLIENNQEAAARFDLEKAWSLRPTPSYALAWASLLNDSPQEKLKLIQSALERFPGLFELEWSLAETLEQTGSIDAALQITQRWADQGEADPDFLLLHAHLLKRNQRTPEAFSLLEKLNQAHPEKRNVAEALALWYATAGDNKIAAVCKQMIDVDSLRRDPLPYYYLGIYYGTIKQNQSALNQFDRAIQIDYQFADAYIEKASLLYEQRLYTQSLNVLGKAFAIAPDNAAVYYWTGKCQQATGDTQSAKMNYLKAYNLDKSFSEAKQAADQLK